MIEALASDTRYALLDERARRMLVNERDPSWRRSAIALFAHVTDEREANRSATATIDVQEPQMASCRLTANRARST